MYFDLRALTLICSMISFINSGTTTGIIAAEIDAGLLLHDVDAGRAVERIVRLNQRADAVLELRDHLAAAVVRRRVRGEQDQNVEVELNRIAANLHVALFEDVEQTDLHQFIEFGYLIHRKDAAVHTRNEAEVQRFLRGHAHAGRQLGRVDFADHVGELRARRQPFGVALLARPPGDADCSSGLSATSRLPADVMG